MDLKAFEKLFAKTKEANAQTELRLTIAADFGIVGEDPSGRRRDALMKRLEGTLARRTRELTDAACKVVTGQSWNTWCKNLGDGPRAGYRPSIDGGRFGVAASVMAESWQIQFESEPYVYGVK